MSIQYETRSIFVQRNEMANDLVSTETHTITAISFQYLDPNQF